METEKHMITKIGKEYFDITGKVDPGETYTLDESEHSTYYIAVAFPQKKMQKKRYLITEKLSNYPRDSWITFL